VCVLMAMPLRWAVRARRSLATGAVTNWATAAGSNFAASPRLDIWNAAPIKRERQSERGRLGGGMAPSEVIRKPHKTDRRHEREEGPAEEEHSRNNIERVHEPRTSTNLATVRVRDESEKADDENDVDPPAVCCSRRDHSQPVHERHDERVERNGPVRDARAPQRPVQKQRRTRHCSDDADHGRRSRRTSRSHKGSRVARTGSDRPPLDLGDVGTDRFDIEEFEHIDASTGG
jgi:hypothetical protein